MKAQIEKRWRSSWGGILVVVVAIMSLACAEEVEPDVDSAPASEESEEHAALDDEHNEEHAALGGDHNMVFHAEKAGLRAKLSRDAEAGLVTAPIAVDDRPFDRVAMRFDADRTPDVDVRVSNSTDGEWSDWKPAELTYQEGIAHNAYVDVGEGKTSVQLRFTGVEREELSFLVIDAFEFRPEPRIESDAESDIGQTSQALAANTGVDVTRAGWGASGHSCSVSHAPYRVAIHHTVTPTNDSVSVAQRVQQIQNFHQNTQGWCDIGYHFLVGQDGQVYQGRPEGLLGTHVGGNNSGNLGVSFVGTYTNAAPSGAMMEGGGRILAAISGFYGIALNRNNIRGHREYGGTACPGDALFGQLDHLIDIAQGADPGGGQTDPQGCTQTEADNCGGFGCGCVDGECAGGFCDGSGCTAQQEENCAAFGCGCVDGECAGGFCDGSGCTAKQEQDCGNFGCGCVDGECAGGFCEGSGCTAKQEMDCGNFGCSCVDGACAGGFCDGSGCTALQTINCGEVGCNCVDGECAGGFCDGTGCTAKQESDCGNYGCDCAGGECTGGFCSDSECSEDELDCGDGLCVDESDCCSDSDCSEDEVCVGNICEAPGELHSRMELSPTAPVYPDVPEPNFGGTNVTATDVSIGDVESRQWTFEEGDPDSSDEDEITVQFQSAGDHQISLEVCTAGDSLCDVETKILEVLDPAPTLGNLTADLESTPVCLPVEFTVDGVSGYPIPELHMEIVDDATGEVIAEGSEVSSGLWDTTGVEPGQYYARLTASNESGDAEVESELVEIVEPTDDHDLPSECEDGESEPDADAGTGDTGVPDAGVDPGSDVSVPPPSSVDAGESDSEELPEESCGGCSVGGSNSGSGAAFWLVLAIGLVGLRRQNRRRPTVSARQLNR